MKGNILQKAIGFFKDEMVLSIALLLAVISSCIILPDAQYMGYIDFRTLGILFCLMTVMAGLQKIGVFGWVAARLLGRVNNIRHLVLLLLLLCFGFSMFITNDVALITFVPFTFIILRMAGEKATERLAVPVIALETVAANLGSMLTPIGNPQNLYLYGISGLGVGAFIGLMLPYTLVSLALLVGFAMLQGQEKVVLSGSLEGDVSPARFRGKLIVYFVLFLLCLLTVARILPYGITLILVVVTVGIADHRVLARVDYGLLLTFAGFFVFIGNMGRIPAFRTFLEDAIAGNEVLTAVLSSQVISNVPAALLLSGFTGDVTSLIVGTNLGGLGTLIASMASLISYKYIVKEMPEKKGKYLGYFTVVNVIFLIILLVIHYV